MKKFSSISGSDVPKEQIIKEEVNKDIDIRTKIDFLVKSYLKVRVYGAVNPVILSSVGIDGVENFTEAMMSLFKIEDTKKEIELLEEARSYIISNNFDKIESRISDLNLILEKQTASMMQKHIQRVKDILDNSEYNMNNCERLANLQANKIKDGEKAYYRAMTAEDMINDMPEHKKLLKKIYNIFLFRSKQLGYKK